MHRHSSEASTLGARWKRFISQYAAGIDRKEVRRLFDQEATQAFRTLAGPRADEDLSKRGLERFIADLRDVFLGIVLKLSPSRRLLFTVSLLCPLLGLFDLDVRLSQGSLFIDSSPFWFLTSISGLTLLLALELVDRLRVRDELEVARGLQRDLLPQTLPTLAGYRVAHSYQTANEIGGDYYDFLPLPDGRMVVAVGDASGHGMAAGILMAIAHATLRAAIDVDPRPEQVFDSVNRTLYGTGGKRAFMTLFYGVLDPENGELVFANAGHPFPLLRRESGAVEELGRGSMPLGLRASEHWSDQTVVIHPGDRLVLYSDGIPEAQSPDGELFGFERLRRIVGEPGNADTMHERVRSALRTHTAAHDLKDDLTLVVLDRLPPLPKGLVEFEPAEG